MSSSHSGDQHFLITGGAGFIGSHLCEALLERGDHVTVIDDLSTGSFRNIEHLVDRYGKGPESRFRFAIDSITNEMILDRLTSQCDTVIHLAAAVGVRLIIDKPVHTIETNVMGTEAVLKAAQRYRCKLLLASSSEVYGKSSQVPFREDADIVLGPTCRNRWAYAASKLTDEFLALAYHKENSLPVVLFRLFNTVGPRQRGRYGMVIPRLISQTLEGKPLTVYGDGTQSRCFLHVRDAVDAIIMLAENSGAIGEVYNIGADEEISIADLAQRILKVARRGREVPPIRLIPYEEAYEAGFEDMRRRRPDTSKIRQLVGWRPKRRLECIIKDTLEYLEATRAKAEN